MKSTPQSAVLGITVWACHVWPLSIVTMTCPLSRLVGSLPTIHPCLSSMKKIPLELPNRDGMGVCNAQFLPPFIEMAIDCPNPTAHPFSAFTKNTDKKSQSCVCIESQVFPPSIVFMFAGYRPTAHPVSASKKNTLSKSPVVPENWFSQDSPPSIVLAITPFTPTTQPTWIFTKNTSCSVRALNGWRSHLLPLFVVLRIRPSSPTTQPMFLSTK